MFKNKSEIEKMQILFNKYSKNEKFADKNFIRKMIEYSAKDSNVDAYIDDIIFSKNLASENLLLLDEHRLQLIISAPLIKHLCEKVDNISVSNKTKTDINNMIIMKNIFEFMEKLKLTNKNSNSHPLDFDVLQVKNYIFDADIYNNLMNSDYSIEEVMEKSFKKIDEDSDMLPINRIAKIKALKKCLEVISNKENTNKYLLNYVNNELLSVRLRGYVLDKDKVQAPTTDFFSKSGQTKTLNKILWYNKDNNKCLKSASSLYSLEERLDYGLPISVDEYNKVKVKTNK